MVSRRRQRVRRRAGVRMGSASIGSSSSSSGYFRIFRIFLILLECSSSASACTSCFTSSLTIDRDLMLLTRSGCEPPRQVATGRVQNDLTGAAVHVLPPRAPQGVHKGARCRIEHVPRALRADNQSLVEAQSIGCSFCLASEMTRRKRCTTEASKLPDFQISHP
jgi:hypothetical protein